MSWKPKIVKTEWRYNYFGSMDEVNLTEAEVYGPLLNDLLVLIYNLK